MNFDDFVNFYDPVFNQLSIAEDLKDISLAGYVYLPEGEDNIIVCRTNLDQLWTLLNEGGRKKIVNKYIDPVQIQGIPDHYIIGYFITGTKHNIQHKIEVVVPNN